MKIFAFTFLSFILLCPFLQAGVVITMETKDLKTGKTSETTQIYAHGGKTRTDTKEAGRDMSMIFRDNALWMIDHKEKRYQVMDQQTIEQLSNQISGAMKQYEEQMAKLTPEQRQMMEKMMKGQMQQMTKQGAIFRVEEAGSGTFRNYTCKKYNVYLGEKKFQEIYATSPSQVEGAEEVMQSFRAMAEFSRKIMESIQQFPFAAAMDNAYLVVDKIEGIPVRTVYFEDGQPVKEQYFHSSEKKVLPESLFTPPTDYKKMEPFKAGK